jgi:hypothetical protein
MSTAARAGVEDSLRRIEELVQTVAAGKDAHARQSARELLQAALDLHGVALAKLAARLCASEEGCGIYAELGRDEQVRAILLLHGLHPESAEDRIRGAVADLENRLFGVSIRLLSVSDGIARVSVDPGPREWEELCREIGGALIDAAPDLDDIAIDRAAVSDMAFAAAAL